MTTSDINMGDRVRDRITGFTGVVTGLAHYITGCTQLLIAPPARDGAHVEGHWYDIDRCEVTEAGVVDLGVQTATGPDLPAPVR